MNVTTANNILKIRQNHDETLKYLRDINLNYEQMKNKLGLSNDNKSSINTIDDITVNIPEKKQEEAPKTQEVAAKKQEVAAKKQEVIPKIQEEAPKTQEVVPKNQDVNAIILNKKQVAFTNMNTNDSSVISKNIMDHIFNLYNGNVFIEKYLKPETEVEGLKSLIYCMSNLFKLIRILNQDFFMRLLTILSEKEDFDEMFELINADFEDKDKRKQFLIDSLFIKFNETTYANTIKIIYEGKDTQLTQKMNRDSIIYCTYYPGNYKIMLMNQFLYDFIQLNNETALKKLLVNTKRGNGVVDILTDLIDNVLKLKELYDNYKDKIDTINDFYKKIVDKHSRIFSYVKYRQDTATVNPRYSVYYDENNYLYLRYCNIDGRIGFTDDNDDTSYDYDSAVEFINLNVSKNEYYTFGPFHGIYSNEDKYNTNDKIAQEFSVKILQKLIDEKQNVCILPIGQSGSGKTSSVIYFSVYDPKKKTMTKMDGVMVEVCNLDRFTDHFDKIEMKMKNIYLQHGPNDYKVVELGITYKNEGEDKKNNEPKFIFKDGHWVFEEDNSIWMSESINNAFENREVEPTPNNENSSRSHVIVCLKLFVRNNSSEFVNFIVCDLAGAENKFQIDSLREIKKFDERYKISNKYKEGKGLIKFDNYYRTDNENSAKYSSYDEYKKYNDSKTNLQKQYKKYIDLIKTTSKNDGAFVDFDDDSVLSDKFLKKNELEKCNNSLNNFKSDDYKQNTNEYIQTLEKQIDKLYKETEFSKKESELYDIMNEYRDSLRIYDIKGFKSKVQGDAKAIEGPDTNINIIKKFIDFFDIGLNFNKIDTISLSIPNKIFIGSKSEREYSLEGGETTSFKYYVENNRLINYFDFVIYLKSKKLLDAPVTFSNYENFNATNTIETYKIFLGCEKSISSNITETLKDNYNSKKKEYLSTICQLGRLLKIYYNGMLRVNEGVMINKSLKELKDDVKLLVLKSFINPETNTLPFIFDKEVFPYCRNLYSDENIYEKFYNTPDKDNTKSGQIIKVIKDFGVDVSKLNFAVFTVINLSDYFREKNKVTNNPPNPPYININNLIYLTNVQKIFPNGDKLKSEINDTINKLNNYDFYKNQDSFTKFKEKYEISKSEASSNTIIDFTNSLINLIQPNNSATLIGTVADSVSIQTITLADQIPCAENNQLFEERQNFPSEFNLVVTEKPSQFYKPTQAKPRQAKAPTSDKATQGKAPQAKATTSAGKKSPGKGPKRGDGKRKKSKIHSKRRYNKI